MMANNELIHAMQTRSPLPPVVKQEDQDYHLKNFPQGLRSIGKALYQIGNSISLGGLRSERRLREIESQLGNVEIPTAGFNPYFINALHYEKEYLLKLVSEAKVEEQYRAERQRNKESGQGEYTDEELEQQRTIERKVGQKTGLTDAEYTARSRHPAPEPPHQPVTYASHETLGGGTKKKSRKSRALRRTTASRSSATKSTITRNKTLRKPAKRRTRRRRTKQRRTRD